jgi:hypothetical protein
MNEETQDLEFSYDEWQNPGMEKDGPVMLHIDKAEQLDKISKAGNPYSVCNFEFTITARPDQKLEQTVKYWEEISLHPKFITQFRNIANGAGVRFKKPSNPEEKIKVKEVIKALPGRSVAGIMSHESYTWKGEERKKNKLGKKFAADFAGLQ